MLQIFALRPKADATSPHDLYRKYLTTKAATIYELFDTLPDILEKCAKELGGTDQLYNLHYHLGSVLKAHLQRPVKDTNRDILISQACLAIDVDYLENPDDPECQQKYIEVISKVTGTDPEECAIVSSGNGLHYIIGIPEYDGNLHDETKAPYANLCREISAKLKEEGLPGQVDTQLCKTNATLRLPGTENRKIKDGAVVVKKCVLINGNLRESDFDFDKFRRPDEHYSEEDREGNFQSHQVLKEQDYKNFVPDVEAIMSGCRMLEESLREGGKTFSEPLWYASLGVVGHFPEGSKWAHAISNQHRGYSYEATEKKYLSAIKTPPRTCEHIATMYEGCSTCKYKGKVNSPYGLNSSLVKKRKKLTPAKKKSSIKEQNSEFAANLDVVNESENLSIIKKEENLEHNCFNQVKDMVQASSENTVSTPYCSLESIARLIDKMRYPMSPEIFSTNYDELKASGFLVEVDDGKKIKYVRDYEQAVNYYFTQSHFAYSPSTRTVFVWEKGAWKEFTSNDFRCAAQNLFYSPIRQSTSKEHDEFMKKCQSFNNVDANFLVKPNYHLCFQNGVLNTQTMEFMPNGPEFPFIKQDIIGYNYDPSANECPLWDANMKLVTCDRPHLQLVLEEYLGYCLYGGEYTFHKFLFLSGSGSNGKTSFISTLKELLGEENYSAINMHEIGIPFKTIQLHRKLANISEEAPDSCLKYAEVIKALTGGSSLTDSKKFKDLVTFVNKAKLIISSNFPPIIRDESQGMLRRPIIVPFDFDFEKNSHLKILNYHTKLRPEYPAIFNRALAKFKEALKRGDFTTIKESEDFKNLLLMESNPEFEYFESMVKVTGNPTDFVKTEDMFKEFLDSNCNWRGSKIGFSRKINAYIKKFNVQGVIASSSGLARGFIGLKFMRDLPKHLQKNNPFSVVKDEF